MLFTDGGLLRCLTIVVLVDLVTRHSYLIKHLNLEVRWYQYVHIYLFTCMHNYQI
jgi:hypothetical protein